ncbi:MAG: exosortase/archaeosortase family protein [Phycisphaerales bacterium]
MSAIPSAKPAVAPPASTGLLSATGLVQATLLGAAFVAMFHTFFYTQHLLSWGSGDWSHAYFVPLISLYVIWQQREKLSRLPSELFWPGLIPMVLGVCAYVFFQIGPANNHMGQGWAAILTLFGMVLLTTGPRITLQLLLPIAYLVFGVTVAQMIMLRVTFKLQLFAAYGAYVLLNMLGVNTSISGYSLEVVNGETGVVSPLDVAQACSGMRMVIAFAALGVAVALVGVKHWWQRTALILLAVPVALLMNVVRVAVLGVGSLYNPSFAQGQAHMLIGTILLVPAFFLYMGIVWALNKLVVETPEAGAAKPKPVAAGKPVSRKPMAARVDWAFVRRPSFYVPFVVMLAAAVGLQAAVTTLGIHLKKLKIDAPGNRQVSSIPAQTASWQRIGPDAHYSEEYVDELGTPNYLSRDYIQKKPAKGKPPARLNLHLAYYTGQIDTIPHVQERCNVAAGLNLIDTFNSVPIRLDTAAWTPLPGTKAGVAEWASKPDARYTDGDGAPVHLPRNAQDLAMRVSVFEGKGGARQTGGYFFIANGGHCASAEDVRSLAFKLEDDYAFYLKVQISVGQALSAQEFSEIATSVLEELLPEIMRCVPDWSEVEAGRFPPDNPRSAKAKATAPPRKGG